MSGAVAPRAVLCYAVLMRVLRRTVAGSAAAKAFTVNYWRECSCALERKWPNFANQKSDEASGCKTLASHPSRDQTSPPRTDSSRDPRAVPGALCPGRRAAAAPRERLPLPRRARAATDAEKVRAPTILPILGQRARRRRRIHQKGSYTEKGWALRCAGASLAADKGEATCSWCGTSTGLW